MGCCYWDVDTNLHRRSYAFHLTHTSTASPTSQHDSLENRWGTFESCMKRYLRDRLPKPEVILENKYLVWMKPWLGHPRLWHMHRGSVSLGVAIGAVTGLIPGPVQVALAIIISIPVRANVLAAAAATFLTNPLTIVPIYMLAFSMGTLVTGEPMATLAFPDMVFSWREPWLLIPAMWNWSLSLGPSLVAGLAMLAVILAVVGYFGTRIVWRWVVTKAWRTRHSRKRW